MKITIGANIKSLRQKKGITQDELSAAMNVSSAAVSKWERDETYPDITLLQPLAYYFGVSLDELMGYNKEKIQADIDNTVELYLKSYLKIGAEKTREFITKAYSDYPNDYRIMNYYMWNIAGDAADNDPASGWIIPIISVLRVLNRSRVAVLKRKIIIVMKMNMHAIFIPS